MADKDERSADAAAEEQTPQADTQQQTEAEQQPEAQSEAGEAPEQGVERELDEARQKADENWEHFLRARAELENVRRRAERDLEQAHKYGLEKFAADLLAVKDGLEMGLAAANEPGADVTKLREGMDMTLKMFSQVFERFNVVELNPQGERFDPSRHEAMAAQESADHEPNTVMHVVQKGYMLSDRVLRPARVLVSKAPPQPTSESDGSEG